MFILIILGVYIFNRILHAILCKYIKKLTQKTKSDLDDEILKLVQKPVHRGVMFIGIYIALRTLTVLEPYATWIKGIFFVLIVLTLTSAVSRMFSALITAWFRKQKRFAKTPELITKIIAVIVYVIALLMIFSHFGVEITPLLATLGVGGLAVGLALQNTLSNLFAGLHIISDQPINVGDFVEVEGISGYVEDIGWRSTRIRTLGNNYIIIPNAKLAESVITNLNMPQQEMSAGVKCGVGYDQDLEKVEKITLDVAKKIQNSVEGAVKGHEPGMRYKNFGDSNIEFSVYLRVKSRSDKTRVIHEFIKALKKEYDKNKIEISYPVRKILK